MVRGVAGSPPRDPTFPRPTFSLSPLELRGALLVEA